MTTVAPVPGDGANDIELSDTQILDIKQTHEEIRPNGEIPTRWEPPVEQAQKSSRKES